ncbi:Cyn operon transcriptional activator [Labilithrix luteola]|uniref:Cyn operon transcriptional activator n=1 Tax=Labilithrix luteola TaxID=1391654 RepID=A0A0K1Q4I2_9BACT|nr:LysR substrate-binding domain-containing protein [Labilithrix luteola]AKV00654.1 Cyn operon transcriptional activator [Labilithrix luteola]
MELRHLRYFLAVADAAHFGKAARRLHVSQPTLSQQIKQLEDELGSPLFERGRSGARLTQAGEIFRTHASRVIEDVRAGTLAVEALRGLTMGTLRVGYLPSLRGLAVPALSAVLRKYPGVRIHAQEIVVSRVEGRLAEGKLDVGLALGSTRLAEVEAEPVFESRLGLVVGKRHRLAGETHVELRALDDEPFALLARGLRARSSVDTYLASTKFSPRIVLESSAVGSLLAIVRAGLAVTLLPEPRFADPDRLPVLALSPTPPSQLTALLFRRDVPRTPSAVAFAEEVRALASDAAGR